MAQNETEFIFKARDEVSRVLTTLNSEIERMGTVAGKTAQQTGTLAQFARAQMREQRVQNFLFREGTQAMGALSLGLAAFSSTTSDASRQTKELSNSLNAGFLAFQGISFALTGLNPVIATTVAAAAGLAVVFGTMSAQAVQNQKDIADLQFSIAKLRLELGQISSAQYLLKLNALMEETQKRMRAATETTVDWAASLLRGAAGGVVFADNTKKILEEQLKLLNLLKESRDVKADDSKKSEEEQKKNKAAIDAVLLGIDEQDSAFRKLHDTVFPRQAAQNKQIQDKIDLYRELGGVLSVQKIQAEGGGAKQQLLPLPKVDEIQASFGPILNVTDHIVENFVNMGTTAQQTADVITNTMVGAADIMAGVFVGAFDRIKDAFKALIQSMIAELIKIGLLKLFAGIATGGGSVVADVAGSAFGKTAARPVPRENAGATVTINVTSESRSVTVTDRRRAMRTIEEAIFTEK